MGVSWFAWVPVAAACLLCARPGFAQSSETAALAELSLADLLRVEVRGATRYAQPLSESPASVAVIEREELQRQPYRHIGDALASLPGVYLSNDRNYTYLGVRGFNRSGDYNSRIVLLTDGSRRNDALYDQAMVGHESPIEIDWVKRLEFVSGPGSALYGGNALFGIANAILLEGRDIEGARVSLDAGSGESRRLGIVAGQRLADDGDIFFGFAAYRARGEDHYYPEFDDGSTDGRARGLDDERYHKAYARLRWGDWRLVGSFSTREKGLPTGAFETAFGVDGTRTVDTQRLFELAHDSRLANGWLQQFRVFTGAYRYDGDYRYAGAPDNRDQARADWHGADYRLGAAAGATHRWMLGVEGQWNTRLAQRNFDVAPAPDVLDVDRPSRTVGLFVQDEWRLDPRWLLNLSLRYDRHSDYSPFVSPRVALIFQPDDDMSVKLMTSRAYRPPNAYERYYDDGGVLQKANPGLRPERIRSIELAADFRLGWSGRAGVAVYRNEIGSMIDQVADPVDGLFMFTNLPRVRSHGVELDGEHRWSGGYRLRGSVGWQQSWADGSTLGNSPQLLGKLVFSLPVATGWTLAGHWHGMSGRRTLGGRVAGHNVFDLMLSSERLGGFGEWSVAIHNLGDVRYADPVSSAFRQDAIEQDGRQFRLRWTLPL